MNNRDWHSGASGLFIGSAIGSTATEPRSEAHLVMSKWAKEPSRRTDGIYTTTGNCSSGCGL